MTRRACVVLAALAVAIGPAAAGPAAPTPQPGKWRFTRTFVDISLPGVPADATRDRLNIPRSWDQCVTPAAVGTLYDSVLGTGCRGNRTLAADGRLRIAGTCGGDRLEFVGVATPRRITGIMTKNGRDGSYLKAQLALDRLADC